MNRRLSLYRDIAAAMAVVGAGFFCVISFIAAQTPAQAALAGHMLPAHWEAGVWNHGHYYRWYLIGEHPLAFGMSCLGLLAGFVWGVRAAGRLAELRWGAGAAD